MGIVITYGSYLPKERNILGASIWIIILDTTIALMAGLAIFPALFAVGMAPEAGPGLVFKIMPVTLHSFGVYCGAYEFDQSAGGSGSVLHGPVEMASPYCGWGIIYCDFGTESAVGIWGGELGEYSLGEGCDYKTYGRKSSLRQFL